LSEASNTASRPASLLVLAVVFALCLAFWTLAIFGVVLVVEAFVG